VFVCLCVSARACVPVRARALASLQNAANKKGPVTHLVERRENEGNEGADCVLSSNLTHIARANVLNCTTNQTKPH
jgi:hypothetical protein